MNYKESSERIIKRLSDIILKTGAILIILEPFWMLFPFAGFFYGSILNLDFLQNSYYTIWLLYFIFPVQTLLPVAMTLTVVGFAIFIIGAFQIYSAKIRKSGMVKTVLYKKFRHPQYSGLTLFCIGILLIWGRFIAYIVFFLMIILYYFLAKKEEKKCLGLFGKEYEDYKKTTYFLFSGERIFYGLGNIFSSFIPNKTVRITLSFLLIIIIGIGSCFAVLSIRLSSIENIPYAKTEISFTDNAGPFQKSDVILLKGFSHHIKRFTGSDEDLSDYFLKSFTTSEKIKQALKEIDTNKINTLLLFFISRTVREKKTYYDEGRGDIFVLLLDSPVKLNNNNFYDFRNRWKVRGALQVNEFDLKNIQKGSDPIKGETIILRPFKDESIANFQKRMTGIFNIYLTGLKTKAFPFNKIFER
jgi:protein-S-isoprenylcysteine O-methyltransferase Ste14